jgi:predicted RNase H-like HicB family nuclease
LDRICGSHRQCRHPARPGTVMVAGKPSDTLHPRTEGSILRQAQIERRPAVTGYVVIIERDEAGGYSAWAPDLPGVIAAAGTYDQCLELMREAVELHIQSLREHGEPIPVPAAVGAETIVAA